MSILWATRGRTWGFRFLWDGGCADPMASYDEAFPADVDEPVPYRRLPTGVAWRLADPEGRCDRSGRRIVHEFIVTGALADGLDGDDDARARIWPLAADEYAAVWDRPDPPGASTPDG